MLGPDHHDTAHSLNILALVYCSQGATTKAEPLFLCALEILQKVLGPDHPETIDVRQNLERCREAIDSEVAVLPTMLFKESLKYSLKSIQIQD